MLIWRELELWLYVESKKELTGRKSVHKDICKYTRVGPLRKLKTVGINKEQEQASHKRISAIGRS